MRLYEREEGRGKREGEKFVKTDLSAGFEGVRRDGSVVEWICRTKSWVQTTGLQKTTPNLLETY